MITTEESTFSFRVDEGSTKQQIEKEASRMCDGLWKNNNGEIREIVEIMETSP
jgi:hypothetical protein